jgi:hypothetical protein
MSHPMYLCHIHIININILIHISREPVRFIPKHSKVEQLW